MKRLAFTMCLTAVCLGISVSPLASARRSSSRRSVAAKKDPWEALPFTAREWARQTLLPYRRIPLKNGGSMDVQQAYDLYLEAGQPDYPDMSTPGLVTEQELRQQMKIGAELKKKS